MLNHPVIRQIREQLDRLKHLENIECVPPMRKDETLGVGITFSVDDLAAARDADAAVIQIETATGVNYYFDSTIQVRETDGTWSDGEAIWALDLESASSLTLGKRYIAVAVRDEFGNTVSEAQGPYYVSIDVGYGHALTDTTWWIKIVGSLTPASWSGVTAYVVGNLVVSGGIDYVCISAHTNHVPPNATYWVPLVLNDAGAYNGSKAYVAGDYVRELRRLWAFSSATGGGGGSAGSITTDSGTATGPDYIFDTTTDTNTTFAPPDMTFSASGSTVTLTEPRYKGGDRGCESIFTAGGGIVTGGISSPPDGGIDWTTPTYGGGGGLTLFDGLVDDLPLNISAGTGFSNKQALARLSASRQFIDGVYDPVVTNNFVVMAREAGGVGFWYYSTTVPDDTAADYIPTFYYQTGFSGTTATFSEGVTGTHNGVDYIGGHRVGGTFTLTGTTTNDNAAAGVVGEYVSSIQSSGSASSLTTATAANITSISLTAGDWDVEGYVTFTGSAADISALVAGATSTSATIPTDGTECPNDPANTGYTGSLGIAIPRKRFPLASTTTIYLVGKATFSAGSVSAYGQITARRMR